MSRSLAVLLLASPLSAATPPLRALDAIDDVVVRARPGVPPPPLGAVDYYRRHCFDAARLTGSPAAPEDDPDRTRLAEDARRRFGVTDAAAPAFGLRDDARGYTLLLSVERFARGAPWLTVEQRCTLVVIGGDGHDRLASDMGGVWRAGGTRRPLPGLDAAPALRGWRRWYWSGMPARGSRTWRALLRDGRSGESAALRVLDPDFYARYDYLAGELMMREGSGRASSVLRFVRVHRPAPMARAKEKGGPEGPPPSPIRSDRDQKSR